MKFFIIASVLFISLSVINCQREELEDESELIPPKNYKNDDKYDKPLVTINIPDGKGIIDRLRERMSSSFDRIRNRMQEHYERRIERLQRKAVDSMERLKSYVDRRISSTNDQSVKDFLQKLSENIEQIMTSLRSLTTSVETKITETADKTPKLQKIPEYKIDERQA